MEIKKFEIGETGVVINGSKIVSVVFSKKPEISDNGNTRFNIPPTEVTYGNDTGCIDVTLDNGYILTFWNSEWGGMTIQKSGV